MCFLLLRKCREFHSSPVTEYCSKQKARLDDLSGRAYSLYLARGTTHVGSSTCNNRQTSHSRDTERNVQKRPSCYKTTIRSTRSMPCPVVTGGFRQELLAAHKSNVRSASRPVELFPLRQTRGRLFSALAVAWLSSTQARCTCKQRRFIPRGDVLLRYVKYRV